MRKKINVYFFGETGVYDEYNPAYVCNKELVPEILYIIANNEPFSISKKEIIKELKIDEDVFNKIINSLKLINAIDIEDDKYKLNFTVFLEEDMPLLDDYFSNSGRVIGNKIIDKKDIFYEKISKLTGYNCFTKERLLYHVICDSIFDGTAFDFFTEKKIFLSSKMQPGNRDYIVFGYEDNEKVEGHSNRLLCSSNNYKSESFVFNSFGDSEGIRKDMFRYFRKVIKALEKAAPFDYLNLAYIKLLEDKNREIAENCGELLLRSIESKIEYSQLPDSHKDIANFLTNLGYLNINEESGILSCNVPVFINDDYKIINELSEIILTDICNEVKNIFDDFEENAANLTAIKHKVNVKEIAIELWHQVFGFTNEYLVEKGFVEAPEYKEGEGRYLRSFQINK